MSPFSSGWAPTDNEWELATIVLNAYFRLLQALLSGFNKINIRKLEGVGEETGMGLVRGWKDCQGRGTTVQSVGHTHREVGRVGGNTGLAGPLPSSRLSLNYQVVLV